MPSVPGLRSPYDKVGGLVAIGRMFDKIRLFATGQLPEAYRPFLGESKSLNLDARCCRFLGIRYADLVEQAKSGRCDEELMEWAFAHGHRPDEDETDVWNGYNAKLGWRDTASSYLRKVLEKSGFAPDAAVTFFDYMDLDEGRPLRFPVDPPAPTVPPLGTHIIPGLRSPYDAIGGLVHFGRMLDKIRLHREGKLPPAWEEYRGFGKGFDGLCCRFLRIDYAALENETLKGGSDEELLAWAFAQGRQPSEEQIYNWSTYLSKRGWRDVYTPRLHFRLEEAGLPIGTVLTGFDFIDLDEGRPPRFP